MATSSLKVTVKKRLVDLLGTIEDVQVEYSPGAQPSARRVIALGDARATTENPGFKAGRKKRNESWDQDIWVFVRDERNPTAEAADEAAEALAAEIEDLIADDPTLGVVGLSWGVVSQVDAEMPGTMSNKWVARWRVQISCMAQLT